MDARLPFDLIRTHEQVSRSPERRIKASVQRMSGYVPGEQPTSADIIKLNTNENPYPPAPGVAEVCRGFDLDGLRKYPDPVSAPLCDQLADLYDCQAENVIVGNGSDEILALCTRAFVEDDQKIGFFDPSYSLYPILSEIRDVPVVATPLGDAFEWREPVADGCGLFMLANPNAPSGLGIESARIRSFCEAFEGVVIVDEAYAEFADDHCLALALELPNVLVVRTLSKSYALAGIRLGYALGHPALISALMKIKDSYNVNALTQAMASAALADQGYLVETVSRVKATRARLQEALQAMDFDVMPSQTNFLFVRPTHRRADALFAALRERNILVRHFTDERVCDYLRITVGTDDEIDALLRALKDIQSS